MNTNRVPAMLWAGCQAFLLGGMMSLAIADTREAGIHTGTGQAQRLQLAQLESTPGQGPGGYGMGHMPGGYGMMGPGDNGMGQMPGSYGMRPGQDTGGNRMGQMPGGHGMMAPGQGPGDYGMGQMPGSYGMGPGQGTGGNRMGQMPGGHGMMAPGPGPGDYGMGQMPGSYGMGPGQDTGGYGMGLPAQGGGHPMGPGFGAPGYGMPPGGQQPGMMGGAMGGPASAMMNAVGALDLTDEQRSRFNTIRKELNSRQQEIMSKIHVESGKLRKLQAEQMRLGKSLADLRGHMMQAMMDAANRAEELLTEEQREAMIDQGKHMMMTPRSMPFAESPGGESD